MSDHDTYVAEFGPEVAACIERTLQAEREATAAVADAGRLAPRGQRERETRSLSGAHRPSDPSSAAKSRDRNV
jgi:hypothetical protein